MLSLIDKQSTSKANTKEEYTLPEAFHVDDDRLDVWMAEDMKSDAMLTKLALEATNVPVHVTTIKNGKEVLTKLSHSRMCFPQRLPDLIMLDLGLPDVDGFEILDALSTMPSSLRAIPIVIITAHEHFDYVRNVYPLYVLDYLKKPCNAEHMRSILMRVRSERDGLRAAAI